MSEMKPPPIKKIRGSYFPPLPSYCVPYANIYTVELVDGTVLYQGYDKTVARLVHACFTPRCY